MKKVLFSNLPIIFNKINEDKKNNLNSVYGAKELKGKLSTYAYKSFGIVMSSLILFIGVYVTINGVKKTIKEVSRVVVPPTIIENFKIPSVQFEKKVIKNNISNSTGTNANATNGNKSITNANGKGNYIPTNSDVILAGIGTLDIPFGKEFEGVIGDLTKDVFANNKNQHKDNIHNFRNNEDENDDFVELEPKLDMAKLQSLIEYPSIALKSNIEGRVVIKVLIKKDGYISKYVVEHSENVILNKAAIDALLKYGKFVPAFQNGKNIDCWLSVPITFRLR